MPTAAKRKPRPIKKVSTKDSLIDAAEHLFARNGVRDVALQEIGLQAGTANKYAVQYHFGSRERLMRAVFERRLPLLDRQRAEMLDTAKARGTANDPATLLEIIFRPIAEIVDSSGRHTYAAFLLAIYEFERDEQIRVRSDDLAPVTRQVADLLRDSLSHVPLAIFSQRFLSATMMFLDLLVRIDEEKSKLAPEDVVREGLTLANAMMTAPVGVRGKA